MDELIRINFFDNVLEIITYLFKFNTQLSTRKLIIQKNSVILTYFHNKIVNSYIRLFIFVLFYYNIFNKKIITVYIIQV